MISATRWNCDQDSYLGIPGLLQAARDGNVAIANAIGAGFGRSNALIAYLPQLCRHFFTEDLKMPSVETFWCGEEKSLQYVLDNLAKLVIKPSFPIGKSDPIFAETLSGADLESLAQNPRRPRDYIAQPHVVSYSAPVLVNHRVESRRFVLRTFLTAAGDSYSVMTGGLTRVTGAADDLVVSLQQGGGSKDTWILADYPVKEISLLPPSTGRTELSRGGGDLTSRVADDLFWLGRYLQRADGVVRLGRCIFNRLLDPNFADAPQATDILATQLLGRAVPKISIPRSSPPIYSPPPTPADSAPRSTAFTISPASCATASPSTPGSSSATSSAISQPPRPAPKPTAPVPSSNP